MYKVLEESGNKCYLIIRDSYDHKYQSITFIMFYKTPSYTRPSIHIWMKWQLMFNFIDFLWSYGFSCNICILYFPILHILWFKYCLFIIRNFIFLVTISCHKCTRLIHFNNLHILYVSSLLPLPFTILTRIV